MINISDISKYVNNSRLNENIKTWVTKSKLKADGDWMLKLQVLDSSYFHVKSHFEDDGTQKCFLYQAVYRYLKKICKSVHISA